MSANGNLADMAANRHVRFRGQADIRICGSKSALDPKRASVASRTCPLSQESASICTPVELAELSIDLDAGGLNN